MNKIAFEMLADERFSTCKHLMMGSKDREYAPGFDKLYNFNRAAQIMRTTPECALWGMFIKHFTSIQDAVEQRTIPSHSQLCEKITDAINYLVLLEAIFQDEREKINLANLNLVP